MPRTIYVNNEDPKYFSIHYIDHGDPTRRSVLEGGWKHFNRTDPSTRQVLKIFVRLSNHLNEVMVDHQLPVGLEAGLYRVETFVPGKNATTKKAMFTVANNVEISFNGEKHLVEALSLINMSDLYDVWVTLGVYYLDPSRHPDIGRVRQYDFTQEEPPTQITYGPIRWVPVVRRSNDGLPYDAPIGTPEERMGGFPSGRVMFGRYPIWIGEWFDFNPFLSWYAYGYHTGADLNLPGSSAADKGKPIYSVAEGQVSYAGKAGSWGNIIVIEHPDAIVTYPDGHTERQSVFSRYGHVDDQILVRGGDITKRGQNIGFIGLAARATSGWHLHFDISYSDILKRRPAHWPNVTLLRRLRDATSDYGGYGYSSLQSAIMREILSHFVDPLRFIQDNHTNKDF